MLSSKRACSEAVLDFQGSPAVLCGLFSGYSETALEFHINLGAFLLRMKGKSRFALCVWSCGQRQQTGSAVGQGMAGRSHRGLAAQ